VRENNIWQIIIASFTKFQASSGKTMESDLNIQHLFSTAFTAQNEDVDLRIE
jgi:hypothetical protein